MECGICLDDIKWKKKQLLCGHTFHRKCINKWFKNIRTCPICRNYEYIKYKVCHINSRNWFFINKIMFLHKKHLLFGKRTIIKYPHIIKLKLYSRMVYFETADHKIYMISAINKNTLNEIYEQLKNNILKKLRRNISSVSIV
jgi:hypothetical protein